MENTWFVSINRERHSARRQLAQSGQAKTNINSKLVTTYLTVVNGY